MFANFNLETNYLYGHMDLRYILESKFGVFEAFYVQGKKIKFGAYVMQRLACGAHLRLLGPWAWGGLLLWPG